MGSGAKHRHQDDLDVMNHNNNHNNNAPQSVPRLLHRPSSRNPSGPRSNPTIVDDGRRWRQICLQSRCKSTVSHDPFLLCIVVVGLAFSILKFLVASERREPRATSHERRLTRSKGSVDRQRGAVKGGRVGAMGKGRLMKSCLFLFFVVGAVLLAACLRHSRQARRIERQREGPFGDNGVRWTDIALWADTLLVVAVAQNS